MRSVSVSEAKNGLSALLREIRGGTVIVITDRGIPVARLLPPAPTKGIAASAIELAQQGRLVLPERPPNTKWLESRRPQLKGNQSAVRALLEERQASR
ncbi:MAG: type II toxin-antitoxin system Phd/YefM family antitoxin [Gemmatimonadaceae bacterium]